MITLSRDTWLMLRAALDDVAYSCFTAEGKVRRRFGTTDRGAESLERLRGVVAIVDKEVRSGEKEASDATD